MPPKKGKDPKKDLKRDPKKKSATKLVLAGAPPKPKKIPPPPASFTAEELIRYKEVYKAHDEDDIDLVPIGLIPLMLRKLGFNPKTAEIKKLFEMFLEDEFVDTVMPHEWLQMIEAKSMMGDDFELAITKAIAALGHDDEEETGFVDLEVLREELMTWGEPFSEIEFVDWIRMALRDKTYNPETGKLNILKFVENMNNRDSRFFPEPINYFKLDQKTLAEMAIKKAQEEKEEQERKEAEKKAREEARRQKLIADGLLAPDDPYP